MDVDYRADCDCVNVSGERNGESMRELCRAIEMPKEVTEYAVRFDSEFEYGSAEAGMNKLFDPAAWNEGLKELKASLGEDPKGYKMLTCMLHCCGRTWEFYRSHGISGQIFAETMKCFSRFVKEHKESYGCYGFDREWWTARQLSGRLFRIGELEYELREEKGERVIALHIPSDARLEREKVLASIGQAKKFLEEKFPEYSKAEMQCHSWLLSPTLREVLPPKSNILAFQELFDIKILGEDKAGEYMVWVFKRSDIPLEDLPENTSLQRRLKAYLLSGGKVLEAGGELKH